MTTGKTREAKIIATEDAVFGYRPPSAGTFLNSSDEQDDDEDLLTDDELMVETRTIRITIGELKRAIKLAID